LYMHGSYNVGVGKYAAFDANGSYNTAVGYSSMNGSISIVGDNSYITTIGANSTDALAYTAPGVNAYATAIGAGSVVATTGTVVLGRAQDTTVIGATGYNGGTAKLQVTGGGYFSGSVGISTGAPQAALDVNGDARVARILTQAADTGITLTSADFGKTITVTNASAQIVYLPTVTAADIGATVTIVKLGAGNVTIQAAASNYISDSTSGGTIYNNNSSETYATITLRLVTATKWILIGGEGIWTTT
jgi:hypothetical protein